MNADLRINEADIYRWFSIFRPDGEVAEIRVIDRMGTSWSGYFKTPESAIEALKDNPELLKGNVFQTFNAINPTCYERKQKEQFLRKVTATSDDNIVGRDWVFIDIDPIRPSDTNASDDDEKYAISVARKVVKFLLGEGFCEPIVIASANGAHIYLRCEMKNSSENKILCEKFIKVMCSMFDDDRVKIDPVIYNASRFAKLPGTMSGKGDPDSKTHPQRWCRFLKVPDNIQVTDKALFERIANLLPEPPKPSYENNWGREKFDLRSFIQEHGIAVKREVRTDLGTRYILEHCVFNPEHKAPDAMIFQYNDGSIAYKCFHATCSQYKWRDVRLHFEPDAYSRQEYNDYVYKQRMQGRATPFVRHEETAEKGQIWLSLDAVPTIDIDSLEKVQTNIKPLDDKISGGTIMQQLSVLTGRPASGKSTFLDMMILNSVNQGFPVALFSGELPNHLLKNWIVRPAAGYRVQCKDKEKEIYYVPKDIEAKILQWLKGKLWIYNKEYGSDWGNLKKDIEDVIKLGARNIILDNLMTIDLDYQRDYEKSKAQIGLVKDLHEMVRQNNIHIWLVAHPRKQVNFLRYDDIAGASEIANLADNIFIVHRVNQDFENQAKAFFPKQVITDIMYAGYGNVIEIAKNRIPGSHIGELVGVYYDPKSKQMTGENGGCLPYKWDDTPPPSPEPQQEMKLNTGFDNENQMWYNKEQDDGIEF